MNGTNETAFRTVFSGNRNLTSGGGFSNIFQTPAYQLDAVNGYVRKEQAHLSAFRDRFHSAGRGYPDVTALAYGWLTVVDGKVQVVYGTSGSAPIFVSVISLVNNDRLHAGKKSLGFINPALYACADVLNDITMGSNAGCGLGNAFRAACGWDAVTGLGSPDYRKMRDYFMGLP